MRKPRDFDTDLKTLEDKARELRARKVRQLGDLVIATGADWLAVDELAGALIVLTETTDAGKRGGLGSARRRLLSAAVTATSASAWPQRWRHFGATGRPGTGLGRHGHGVT